VRPSTVRLSSYCAVRSSPLRAIAAAHGGTHLLWGIFGTVYLLFATHDLGLGPAAIGIIAGVGGGASFVGAAVAGRVIARLGIGPHIADKVLNHAAGTIRGVAATYNRFEYLAERQAALDAWGRLVESLVRPVPSNVVQLAAPR